MYLESIGRYFLSLTLSSCLSLPLSPHLTLFPLSRPTSRLLSILIIVSPSNSPLFPPFLLPCCLSFILSLVSLSPSLLLSFFHPLSSDRVNDRLLFVVIITFVVFTGNLRYSVQKAYNPIQTRSTERVVKSSQPYRPRRHTKKNNNKKVAI